MNDFGSEYELLNAQRYERFQLGFKPSANLAEIISPFYRPQVHDKVGDAAIRSAAFLDMPVLPGRNHYYDPDETGRNHISRVSFYGEQLRQDVFKRSLAILSFLSVGRTEEGDVRLYLKANVPRRERMLISALREFEVPAMNPSLDLHWDIPHHHAIQGSDALHLAHNEVSKDLGLGHPARGSLPEFKRIVDPRWTYVTGATLLSTGTYSK